MAQIDKPNLHFNTLLYTGDGTSPRSITGVGFQPDMLWIKNRTGGTAYEWRQMDSVRGSNKVLHSSGTGAENTEEYYTVGSFDSDGWTGRNGTGSNQTITGGNDNGYTFCSWSWKAGGANGSANTDGSITSTVSANTTAGFSIVKYAGTGSNATVGHGLGVAPSVVLIKNRTTGGYNWVYGGDNLTSWAYILKLNLTDAEDGGSGPQSCFNSTAPTSSVFSLGTSAGTNNNGNNFIAYCFAEKKGYSKFGSYIGNGNANGTFVYTGFKPAMVLVKRSSSASGQYWELKDNKRDTSNAVTQKLSPNASDTETSLSGEEWDFLSNGFKIRTTGAGSNASGVKCIYMAFAENPIVGSNNVPATAR